MSLTVEAIYENGVLKPAQPLPFKEHEKVRIHIEIVSEAVRRVRQSARASHRGWLDSARARRQERRRSDDV